MNRRLKYPLSVFVVWHPKFDEGKLIANRLYSLFCRDVDEPLSRGLGIPVYFRSGPHLPIDATHSKRNAIALLIDENYMIDVGLREFTKATLNLCDENTRIYPVALCEQAFSIECGLESTQFIRGEKGYIKIKEDFDLGMRKIQTALLHDSARLLMNFRPTWMD